MVTLVRFADGFLADVVGTSVQDDVMNLRFMARLYYWFNLDNGICCITHLFPLVFIMYVDKICSVLILFTC